MLGMLLNNHHRLGLPSLVGGLYLPFDQVLYYRTLVLIHNYSETLDFLNVCHFSQRDDLYCRCCSTRD